MDGRSGTMIMTVKYLTEAEKQESRSLWEEAFPEDSRSFTDYYYREKVKDNQILALVETAAGGALNPARTSANVRRSVAVQRAGAWRVEAMIQMNPYLLQVGKNRWNVDYLVGVATRKDRRRRGYMAMLLNKCLTDSREKQIPFTFLMPADEAIYRPFGFTYIFRQLKWEWKPGVEKKLKKQPLLPWIDRDEYHKRLAEVAEWMNTWMSRHYAIYAVRNAGYLYRLLQELESEEGTFDVYYEDDQIVGVRSEWGLNEREERLLYADEKYVSPVGEGKPAIMARIITPEKVMQAVSLRPEVSEGEINIRIHIEDPIIEENNRVWIWHVTPSGSRMERVYIDPMVRKSQLEKLDLELTITELTSWLFGYEVPEKAKAYDKYVKPLAKVFLDEIV